MERPLESLFERFARHGDVNALEQVFDRAAPELMRIALHLAPDAAQAEDLVQATFVRALENAARFEPERALLPWLIGILAHEAARARRDGARVVDPQRLNERSSVDPAEHSAAREVSAQLTAAVRALPSPYCDVLAPHLFEGERAVDIARKLERAPGTVRMQILRGLELLRKALPPSLATAALLETGTRGHAAVRELVRARAAELAPTLAQAAPGAANASPSLARFIGDAAMLKLALAVALPALALTVVLARSGPHVPGAPSSTDPAAREASVELAAPRTAEGETRQESATARRAGSGAATSVQGARPQSPAPARAPMSATELAGRVLDAQGTPVAGARVALTRGELDGFWSIDTSETHRAQLVGETLSGADGAFHLALERGLQVDVHAELGALLFAEAPARHAGQFVELRLDPGHLVQGRITRAADGAPLSGAQVRVFQMGGTHFLERSTVSQGDGSYALRVGFTEGASLEVRHDLAGAAPWLALRFDAQGNAYEDVALSPGIPIEGRVSDSQSGAPIAGATIGEHWTFGRSTTSGAGGAYRLESCNPQGLLLYARAPGYGTSRAFRPTLDADGVGHLDIALQPGHVALGRVVDENGDPLADVYVAAVGQGLVTETLSTRTDADGRFRLEPLSSEVAHALFLRRRDRAVQVYDFPAAEAGQALTDLGQLTLRPSQLVAGRVVDSSGEPVAGAQLVLEGWNGDRFVLCGGDDSQPKGGSYVGERNTLSDDEGRFWFDGVAPGRYRLSAMKAGLTSGSPRSLLVQEGEDRDDLEFVFADGLTLRGLVRDELGHPLAGAFVYALAPEPVNGNAWLPGADTGADGAFEIRGLPAGRYELEVSLSFLRNDEPQAPWLDATVADVEAGGEPVTIVVARGATIEGVVRDAAGKPVANAFVRKGPDDLHPRNTDAAGWFRLEVPANSVWTIEVATGPWQIGARAAGVAAGTHDLVLTVP